MGLSPATGVFSFRKNKFELNSQAIISIAELRVLSSIPVLLNVLFSSRVKGGEYELDHSMTKWCSSASKSEYNKF